jgi:hypothetical protein
VVLDGNSSAVIDDATTSVGENGDVNPGAKTRHGLVDGIVNDFPHQVVETRWSRGTDIHAWSNSNRFKTLKYGDVTGSIAS